MLQLAPFTGTIFFPEVINAEPHQSSSLPLADTCLSLCIYIYFFSLAPDTKQSIFVIQDLFEEISSGKKSSRALAGELLQIMTCNLVNTLKHKAPNVGIIGLHMRPCALPPPPPLEVIPGPEKSPACTCWLRGKRTWL